MQINFIKIPLQAFWHTLETSAKMLTVQPNIWASGHKPDSFTEQISFEFYREALTPSGRFKVWRQAIQKKKKRNPASFPSRLLSCRAHFLRFLLKSILKAAAFYEIRYIALFFSQLVPTAKQKLHTNIVTVRC